MSVLAAAAKVLAESGEPMTTKETVESMAAKSYWTNPAGATPERTLYSTILHETNTKARGARFVKTERGRFAVTK